MRRTHRFASVLSHRARLALTLIVSPLGAHAALAGGNTQVSGFVPPTSDPCWVTYIANLKECKDTFCPNVLWNCDHPAYDDCRETARYAYEHCHG
jgi:hypothetical protein